MEGKRDEICTIVRGDFNARSEEKGREKREKEEEEKKAEKEGKRKIRR